MRKTGENKAHMLASARSLGRSMARGIRFGLPRVYAAGLIVIILGLTIMAVRYLVISLATNRPPAQIVELPRRLDRSVLATERTAWRGIEAMDNPRSPLSHYHRLDSWIAPDHFSGCTQSGCHAPLPHSKRKEVRAFLNMHATSIHCGVCHMKTEERPLSLIWYDLATGKSRPPPAVMEAFDMVMNSPVPPKDQQEAKKMQLRLVNLLHSAAKDAGDLAALDQLADHVAAYRVTSDEFAKVWAGVREALPKHFRGEYGAKLALHDSTDQPILAHPNTEEAVRIFHERGSSMDKDERAKLLASIHPLKREEPRHCTDCHTTDHSLIDFSKSGYPRGRIDSLTNPLLFKMIEHINSGQPMNMPNLLRPTSQPVG